MNYFKKLTVCFLLVGICVTTYGQKYFTKEGEISFYSDAAVEKIEAHNKRVAAVLNTESGAIEFGLLVKAFQFEKALMQEHFNENYMESDKFPKAHFKGKIVDLNDINFEANGKYEAVVSGELTIHGETQPIETNVEFDVMDDTINGETKFVIACESFDIKIPRVVADNIAKEIEVSVTVALQPLVK